MSQYYVVTTGYSAVVNGPFDEAAARVEAEKRAQQGHHAMLVVLVDVCKPKPREAEWQGAQS